MSWGKKQLKTCIGEREGEKRCQRRVEEERRKRRRKRRKVVCSMLQLVAGFLMDPPVSSKFLIPPGSTRFHLLHSCRRSHNRWSTWVKLAGWRCTRLTTSPCEPLPSPEVQHAASPSAVRPLRPELTEQTSCDIGSSDLLLLMELHWAILSDDNNQGTNNVWRRKSCDHKQILEDEILRTRSSEKGALIDCAYGHLWSLWLSL